MVLEVCIRYPRKAERIFSPQDMLPLQPQRRWNQPQRRRKLGACEVRTTASLWGSDIHTVADPPPHSAAHRHSGQDAAARRAMWEQILEFLKLLYFIDYAITAVPIFLPLPPSIQHPPLPQAIPPPLFMSMSRVNKFFGCPISCTVLYFPMAVL